MQYERSAFDAKKDIEAAINYIYREYNKSAILLGSSYSASLALLIGSNNYKVRAVIAFSPGEYFMPGFTVEPELENIHIPVFITCTKEETGVIKKMTEKIPEKYKTIFVPKDFSGKHGAKALWNEYEYHEKYWFELLIFFKSLQST